MKTLLLRAVAAVIATAASLSVCSANETVATERNPMILKTYHAVVKGDIGFLQAFDASLRQVEGTKELLDAFIKCGNCDKLNDTPPPTSLEYWFFAEHVQKPRRMFEAMEMATRMSPSVTIKSELTFDDSKPAPGSAVCPSPKPAKCGVQPLCPDGCDGDVYTGGCQKCTTP
ncbi:MAG TPA: hypothetical protein VEK56_04660 [Vicinamibacterales bacterium]|nr:hypothetical protein [Vicinamibacterales bacterium]